MLQKSRRQRLTANILKLCDHCEALLAFNQSLHSKENSVIRSFREEVVSASTDKLSKTLVVLTQHRSKMCATFGSRRQPEEVLEFVRQCKQEANCLPSLSKYQIETYWFSAFGGAGPDWNAIPPHTRIAINLWNAHDDSLRYYLPETAIYQDMCMAFNLAVDTEPATSNLRDRIGSAQHRMHLHTAVLSAYYFLEAYLNGVAFDYLARNDFKVPQAVKDELTEWNSDKSRISFKSTEWKIDNYPRIILGFATTPSSLKTSLNRALLVGEGKRYRDSIVHHSPHLVSQNGLPSKIEGFLELRLTLAAKTVDAAVALINEINQTLGPHGISLDRFMPRGEDGKFPASIFEETT